MAEFTIHTKGFDELIRDCRKMQATELRREVQKGLKEAAQPVVSGAQAKLSRYQGAAVSNIRPRVRGASVFVQQTKGPVTGRRGDFGSIVMKRALIPALAEGEEAIVKKLEEVIDRLADDNDF